MPATQVYISRSFHDADADVYTEVRTLLEELRSPKVQVIATDVPNNRPLFESVIRPMRDADVVVAIFSHRHKLTKKLGFTAPPYVVAESGVALALNKRLLVFVEDGIRREELGLVDAFNPQWIPFTRATMRDREARKALLEAVKASLDEITREMRPDYTFSTYEAHVTLYPDGYVMTNNRIDVDVHRNAKIRHQLTAPASDGPPPSGDDLVRAGLDDPMPYPRRAFSAFAGSTPASSMAVKPGSRAGDYDFRVSVGGTGAHHYEWMWGMPSAFDPGKEVDYYYLELSQRSVQSVRVVLRTHRQLARKLVPRWRLVTPDAWGESELLEWYGGARDLGAARENPFFRITELSLPDVPRGLDLLLMF